MKMIKNQIDSVIVNSLNCIYSLDCIITPMIIKSCISKLNTDKPDGDLGFNSNHLIHERLRLCVVLSILIIIIIINVAYTLRI